MNRLLPVGQEERRAQLLKGVLDTCLLALLERTPTHAYGLAMLLEENGFPGIGYGKVYPLTGRLRRQGLVIQRTEPSPSGPPRKIFEVTDAGREALQSWTRQWSNTTQAVNQLLASAALPENDEVIDHAKSK